MSPRGDASPLCLRAIDGKHLPFPEFREKVLSAYNIKCAPGSEQDTVATALFSTLKSRQGDNDEYAAQRRAWRTDLAAGRGFTWTAVFPPHILPQVKDKTLIRRLIVPRMSRENLPQRLASRKDTLYELPTPKPYQVCGFNIDAFENIEQNSLTNSLSVSGAQIDFEKCEVYPGCVVFCPFLLFERFLNCQESDVEAARNQCAVAGAQCLRGQQQLFHHAYGLKTVSQPLTVYTCAIGNKFAIANIHYVEGDGTFVMAQLGKFDLENDEQYNLFQTWIVSIETWAIGTFLPNLQNALSQARGESKDTPPVSPALSTTLSIDTTSDPIPNVMSALRTMWAGKDWRFEGEDDTPVLSSIAACGTPLPTRQTRSLSLDPNSPNIATNLRKNKYGKVISPITVDKGWASPHAPIRPSPFSPHWTPASLNGMVSPCRPPTLSPCTPPPEAPWSAKNPVLVLRRRLDVATDEVSELRGQVENLQTELNKKTGRLEKQLSTLIHYQESQIKREQAKEAAKLEEKKKSDEKSLKRKVEHWEEQARDAYLRYFPKHLNMFHLLIACIVVFVFAYGLDVYGTCINMIFELVKDGSTLSVPNGIEAKIQSMYLHDGEGIAHASQQAL